MNTIDIIILVFFAQAVLIGLSFFFVKKIEKRRDEEELLKGFGCHITQEDAGKNGEYLVRKTLGNSQIGKYVFNNYILENRNRSIEIDHIVVNPCGVFVIETKNYRGRILGNREDQKWTQIKENETKTFYNPVLQNKTHVNAIKSILPVGTPIFSLVVFIGTNINDVRSSDIITLDELKDKLDTKNKLLKDKQTLAIALKLEEKRIKISDEEHKENIAKRNKCIDDGICPDCGGKLILKNGKYGEFLGCSNYPRCKFRKNVSE